MNEIEKMMYEKQTENGDKAYTSTGDNLTDLLFMTAYFEKHLNEVNIGTSEKEKVFSMFVRDPRFGLGRRDLGRKLMQLSGVSPNNILIAGRADDLYHIPTDINLEFMHVGLLAGDELIKKWAPRLTGKDKRIAKALCKMWDITEKQYRQLIKTDKTIEYKLSYAEKQDGTPLNDLFKEGNYTHPLVKEIDFEKVPSLAMAKYLNTFSTRDDLKDRFVEYIQAVKAKKAKINTSTANVYDAYKVANKTVVADSLATEVVANAIVDNATLDVELNAICILDTSASMSWVKGVQEQAYAIAYAIASKSTYAKDQVISFSSRPKLMQITGNTLREKYHSMYTGNCSCTDFGKVMELLQDLNAFPEYLVVLSDMEFDRGSNQSKEATMKLFKEKGANTKIIWWNLNARNKTVPEFDEYGNIYLSGYNMQILRLLENNFNMATYIDKILEKYKKDIAYKAE